MSILKVMVPEDLHHRVVEVAAHDGVSLERFVAETLAEKLDEIETQSHNGG